MNLDRAKQLDGLCARFEAACAERALAQGDDEPGFALALVGESQLLGQHCQGRAHLEWPQAITPTTRFYLASEAKPWVAALVLECVDEGLIALDADLRQRVPALAAYEGEPIRLGHLLRHSSGVEDYLGLWQTQLGRHETDVVTRDQALELIRRAGECAFTPGSRHDYSNSNYLLLAELLQQLRGCDLNEWAQRRCFGPWGMTRTSFECDASRVLPERARSYEQRAGAWVDSPVALETWGDGGLWSSLGDLVRAECRWQQSVADQAFLIDAPLRADAQYAPNDCVYRFGLERLPEAPGQPGLAFHGGSYAGFSSLLLRCPAQRVSLVALSNCEHRATETTEWITALWPLEAAPFSPSR